MTLVKNLIEKRFFIYLPLLALVIVVPFLILIFYVQPVADEIPLGIAGRGGRYLLANQFMYGQLNGRYFSSALLTICGASTHNIFQLVTCNKLYIVLVFASMLFATYYFVSSFASSVYNKTQILCASLVAFIVYLVTMPHIADGFYWSSSAITYQLSSALLLLFLALLYRTFIQTNAKRKKIQLFLTSVVLVLLVGCNETMAMEVCGILLTALLFSKVYKTSQDKILFFLLLLVFTSLVFVILAPGNYLYAQNYTHEVNLRNAWSILLISNLYLLKRSFFQLSTLLLGMLAIPFLYRIVDKISFLRKIRYRDVAFLFVVFVILVFCVNAPQSIMVNVPSARVWNVAHFVFFLGWFFILACLVAAVKNAGKVIDFSSKKLLFSNNLIYSLLAVSLLVNPAVLRSISDLTTKAAGYQQQYYMRHSLLDRATGKGLNNVYFVPPLINIPYTIHRGGDISADPNGRMNIFYAMYFTLPGVALTPRQSTAMLLRKPISEMTLERK